MTKTKSTFLALVAVLLSPMAANATPIISASGLASPDSVVDFESIVLAPGSSLTNEYASEGVTFSPNVTYDPQICAGFPGFGGDH
jgi:hypothetical protein